MRRYPLAGTDVEVTALGVKVADEPTIYTLLGQADEKKIAEAVSATSP